MGENHENLDGTALARGIGIALAVYLASFGVALLFDSAGLIPKSLQALFAMIYSPLIYSFMFLLGN